MIKRFTDLILSLFFMVISLPLWIIALWVIKLQDAGPVFYKQLRVGKDGLIISILKFRSMKMDAERSGEPVYAKEYDVRVTLIGRLLRSTAMDELPQLLSILRGDMSFVGPRPERPEFVEKLLNEISDYDLRSRVYPGLTGVAQVLGRYDLPAQEKLKYDLWYIKHQSFWLDVYLIFLSFLITFQGRWETRRDKLGGLVSGLKFRIEKEMG